MPRIFVSVSPVMAAALFIGWLLVPPATLAAEGPSVEQLIREAGNAEDDAARLEILQRLPPRWGFEDSAPATPSPDAAGQVHP
jgi:hypothetical protein